MILVSWVGQNDLNNITSKELGPIASAIKNGNFNTAYLLYNYPKNKTKPYLEYLSTSFDTDIHAEYVKLDSPVHYPSIYENADKLLENLSKDNNSSIGVLLSPGTPAMQVVWILLGKTIYPLTFFQSSKENGFEQIEIPFNIAAEFTPSLTKRSSHKASLMIESRAPVNAAFNDILTKSPLVEKIKQEATIIAKTEVPVLIYGETGTGKELFAKAIHNSSERAKKNFIPLNCGAIPAELIESTLFGHVKGAFTGADKSRKGVFEQAHEGTLFLDEFGELSKSAQVGLLRVLQENEVTPVGSETSKKVDVRIITATNRNLIEDIAKGNFREDLFYRVAVGVLHLPPLRKRKGDVTFLIDKLLEQINLEASGQPHYKHKKISASVKKIMLNHPWKGNIRELRATLVRAALWSPETNITLEAMQKALFQIPNKQTNILEREMNESFNIQEVMEELEEIYVRKAWSDTNKNKSQAAKILGYKNYQSLDKRLKKYGIS